MTSTRSALDADWLGACRRAVVGLERMLAEAPEHEERARETGTRGSGGDRTLVIDRSAEELVLAELDALHAEGYRFTRISEERGEVDFGDPSVRVIIDPIDGSLNAKRGLPHHALSIAVADGETMADVEFGFVYDFGPREEWWARRGEGAWLDGERLDPDARRAPRRATAGSRCSASSRPTRAGSRRRSTRWSSCAYRLRALGTIASSLCQVAAARFDGMVSLRGAAGVDSAAAQLIVREAGGAGQLSRASTTRSGPRSMPPRARRWSPRARRRRCVSSRGVPA